MATKKNAVVDFVTEFWGFLKVRKKLWLLPVILAIAVIAGFLIFTQGSAAAPFIYTLF